MCESLNQKALPKPSTRTARALWAIGAAAAVLTLSQAPASATGPAFKSWEVASEFNDTSNPAGVWSYGYEDTMNVTPFTILSTAANPAPPISGWMRTSDPNDLPLIAHNTTNVAQGPFGGAYVVFPPHAMSLHPGKNCETAVLRFNVPKVGKYKLSGRFYAIDYNLGTTTDVHISVNGVAVWDSFIDYATQPNASFTTYTTAQLNPNDTIDFQVGCGSNGTYWSDTTGLNAVIEKKI
jgi:hypothetical protein